MSKGDTFSEDLLKLIFKGDAIANIADNAASSPLTSLYVSLHSSSPGETGSQTTNEVAYTSYARVAVTRGAGWTVSNDAGTIKVVPAAAIEFPACTGGSATATHFAVGTAASSTGKVLYYGEIDPDIVISSGVTPRLTTASTITED
jgi:hypothetical protein